MALAGKPPAGFVSWQALYAMQGREDKAAVALIHSVGGAGRGSYAGVLADPTRREVTVYVKGGTPAPALAALITRLRESVPVVVKPTPYSKEQVDSAVQRVVRLMLAHKAPDVLGVGPGPAGQGITVTTTGTVASKTARAELISIPVAIHYQTGGPVSPLPIAPASTQAGHTGLINQAGLGPRWSTHPFTHDAGSPWLAPVGLCSIGAPVYNTTTSATGFLAARHCYPSGVPLPAREATGETIGDVTPVGPMIDGTGRYLNLDLELISDPYAQPYVWDNTVDLVNPLHPVLDQFTNPVIGPLDNIPGNYAFTTGSYSGSLGYSNALQVSTTGNYSSDGKGNVYGPLVIAMDSTGASAAGKGDSGGMVGALDPDDTSKVYALGTISLGYDTRPAQCTGFFPDRGKTPACFSAVQYSDINDDMYATGTNVLTAP